MASQLDPTTQAKLLFKAMGTMLPVLLLLCGGLAAWAGQEDDLLIVGLLMLGCGIGWVIFGIVRLLTKSHSSEAQDWPGGRL